MRSISLLMVAAAAVSALLLGAAGPAAAGTPDVQLLATYQPVLHLDPQERFGPSSIQSFVADSDLERFTGSSWVVVDPDPEPGELPEPGTGVFRLNQDSCSPTLALGGLDCYAAAGDEGAGSRTVYGRVAHQNGLTILQYWLFYYDDVYSYFYPPSNLFWQAHEGDWESVNVVLSADDAPLYVGYSEHCLGTRRAWADTPVWDGTHPVAYVAIGSHANYFSAGAHQFNPACVPLQVQQILALFGLGLPFDHTGDGAIVGPPRSGDRVAHVLPVDYGVPPWTAFDGFWGELQYFHAPAPVGTVPFGTSPRGPAYQSLWSNPLGTLAAWPVG
jgi:hypothetical protein